MKYVVSAAGRYIAYGPEVVEAHDEREAAEQYMAAREPDDGTTIYVVPLDNATVFRVQVERSVSITERRSLPT